MLSYNNLFSSHTKKTSPIIDNTSSIIFPDDYLEATHFHIGEKETINTKCYYFEKLDLESQMRELSKYSLARAFKKNGEPIWRIISITYDSEMLEKELSSISFDKKHIRSTKCVEPIMDRWQETLAQHRPSMPMSNF